LKRQTRRIKARSMAPCHLVDSVSNIGMAPGSVGGNRRRKNGVKRLKNRRASVRPAIQRTRFTLDFDVITIHC